MKRYRAWDCETTTRSLAGRKASPFHPENYVVMHAWSDFEPGIQPGWQATCTVRYNKEAPPDGWFKEVLDGCDVLCGANIKFDLQHALYQKPQNTVAYRQWVADGGRIWDILQAEYVLGHMTNEAQMMSLDDVAVRYGGNLKVDQIKAMWGMGIDTADIDRGLLQAYLCGDYSPSGHGHGDIGNTALAAAGQILLTRKRKIQPLMAMEMLALMATTDMEINGIKVDVEKAERCREESLKLLTAAEETAKSLLPAPYRHFASLNSSTQKSAMLYGGEVKWEEAHYLSLDGELSPTPWPEGQQAYPMREEVQPVRGPDGQPEVYKSGRNAGQPKTKKVKVPDTSKPMKTRKVQQTMTLPRRVEPPKGSETETGWSTSADVLDQIETDDALIKALGDISTWSKDISTSYWVEDAQGRRKGLLTTVGEDGIVHPSFHHNRTATGRLSSANP